jgi:hypothetical protein
MGSDKPPGRRPDVAIEDVLSEHIEHVESRAGDDAGHGERRQQQRADRMLSGEMAAHDR